MILVQPVVPHPRRSRVRPRARSVAGLLLGGAVGVSASSDAPSNGCGVGSRISGYTSTVQNNSFGQFVSDQAQSAPGTRAEVLEVFRSQT